MSAGFYRKCPLGDENVKTDAIQRERFTLLSGKIFLLKHQTMANLTKVSIVATHAQISGVNHLSRDDKMSCCVVFWVPG